MKKIKQEPEAQKVNQEINRRTRIARYAIWGIKPRNHLAGDSPSAIQLATLAAALARTTNDSHDKLCSAALNLWFTSHEALNLQAKCNEDYKIMETEGEAAKKRLPEPRSNQQWPITLDEFCKILWPQKDTGDRASIIRAWLKSFENFPPHLRQTVSYAHMNSEKIDRARFYYLRETILQWHNKWNRKQISIQRSEAAKKRHRKARPPRTALKKIVQNLNET